MVVGYLRDNFGSLSGTAKFLIYQILRLLGVYSSLKPHIDTETKRLVFVCHGNICRSAFADLAARKLGLQSISCGLAAKDGDPAFARAIEAARLYQVDLSLHQATKISPALLQAGDLVLAMEPKHIKQLQPYARPDVRFGLLGLYGANATAYLHDPYSCNANYFHHCFQRIENAVRHLKMETTPKSTGM